MAGCHHQCHQWTWLCDGQGSLACCSPWGHKELDMTEQLNWTWHVCWHRSGYAMITNMPQNFRGLIQKKRFISCSHKAWCMFSPSRKVPSTQWLRDPGWVHQYKYILLYWLYHYLEKEMETHSSILAWEILWTENSDGLQPVGLQRVGHDWALAHSRTCTHTQSLVHGKNGHKGTF